MINLDLGPGPNGLDVARHARALRSDLRTVFLSSELPRHGRPGDFARSEFIGKPFRGEQIVGALRRGVSCCRDLEDLRRR